MDYAEGAISSTMVCFAFKMLVITLLWEVSTVSIVPGTLLIWAKYGFSYYLRGSFEFGNVRNFQRERDDQALERMQFQRTKRLKYVMVASMHLLDERKVADTRAAENLWNSRYVKHGGYMCAADAMPLSPLYDAVLATSFVLNRIRRV